MYTRRSCRYLNAYGVRQLPQVLSSPRFVWLVNVHVRVINNFFLLSKYVFSILRRTAWMHILSERCIIEPDDNKLSGVFRNPLKPVWRAHEAYTCAVYITYYDLKFLLQRCPTLISCFESENIHIRLGERGDRVRRIGHYNAFGYSSVVLNMFVVCVFLYFFYTCAVGSFRKGHCSKLDTNRCLLGAAVTSYGPLTTTVRILPINVPRKLV